MYFANVDGGRIAATPLTTIGGYIEKEGKRLVEYSDIGGTGKAPDAELQSLIRCLELASELGIKRLHIRCDSSIVRDAFRSRHAMLTDLLDKLAAEPRNDGLRRAIVSISRQYGRSPDQIRDWLRRNSRALRAESALQSKYAARINELAKSMHITTELIPGAWNEDADALCVRARRREVERRRAGVRLGGRTSGTTEEPLSNVFARTRARALQFGR